MNASTFGPGVPVFIWNRPQDLGVTTGATRASGSKEYVQVSFGGRTEFVPASMLRAVSMDTSLDALAVRGEYSQPVALRRILAHAKISGELTNIFYSMESSQTDFYPHQFKPVLKFLDSANSRLLIADEVGLGKTIEALFIWKELQAREQATRLLVVCPAMLRTKWLGDLKRRFGIAGRIVNAGELLGELRLARDSVSGGQFALITSLEAIRPPRDFADIESQSPRATLARYIDAEVAGEDEYLLDLAIIDEAHYLRNPETANHRIGSLLRDAARHLVLLTATPIQIRSENLFHLLRLLDPDRFSSVASFNELIDANIPIVRAQRSLWQTPPDLTAATASLSSALAGRLHADDSRLNSILAELQALEAADAVLTSEQRLHMIGRLESRSLLVEYMTRSRKREVVGRRVHRRAQTPIIQFTEDERAIYEGVTNLIRRKAEGLHGAPSFALITRQRQMASCIVAALSSWDDSGFLRESLWSDLGTQAVLDLDEEDELACDLKLDDLASPELCKRLKQGDSKYAALLSVLRSTESYDPNGKVIIFAFFRGTLRYLQGRLAEDGIDSYLIMGGMGPDQDLQLEAFRKHQGRAVLLSSEVGSEGIDLQFCSALINYDLPWNPMRVEQRIGRLDRIGQAAEAISITNLFHEDSVEDRILARLYERIEVFKDTIGDLEDILGACVERLRAQFFDPRLSDEERERAADEQILALARDREQRRQLEEQAINLVSFGDYILQQVSRSRERGHWIKPSDYLSYVADFLEARYPETNIMLRDDSTHEYDVLLAESARVDFEAYLQRSPQPERTVLHRAQKPIRCIFDPKSVATSRTTEQLRIGHPLIRWIQETLRDEGSSHPPLVAARMDAPQAGGSAVGVYVFLAQIWQLSGIVDERLLRFGGYCLATQTPLPAEAAESLVTRAAESGRPFLRFGELRELAKQVQGGLSRCGDELLADFQAKEEDFSAENARRCSLQEASAVGHAERTISRYGDTIRLLESKGRRDLLHLWTARIDRAEQELRVKQKRIEEHRQVRSGFRDLCAAIIIVEG